MPQKSAETYLFGTFALDATALELQRDGEAVPLSQRSLRILAQLCRAGDRFVTKTELLDAAWEGTTVSDASVFTALRELRRALGDSGHEQRLIETQRGRGYRLKLPVEAARPAAPAPTAEDFVGRSGLLARLERAWQSTREGQGCIQLIAGEPGIGKTRTVEEFLRNGPEAIRAWCFDGEGAPPFWPWIQIVRALRERWSTRDSVAQRADGPLVALLDDDPAVASTVGIGAAPDARFQVFDAIRAVLDEGSRKEPLLLWIEDLHWADASSLRALEFLSHEAGKHAWQIIVSYRDREAVPAEPLAETLARMQRQAGVTREELTGLSEQSVLQLIELLSGHRATRDEVHETRSRTGGNPLWIRALYGFSTAEGRREAAESTAGTPLGHPAADRVQQVLEGLMTGLSIEARRILECASVLGPEVLRTRLQRLAEVDEDTLATALAEAQRGGIVTIDGRGDLRFVHALLQDVIHQQLPASRAAELHGQAARNLEQAVSPDSFAHASDIARHHRFTLAFGGAARVVESSRRAAERAIRLFAFEEAAEHFAAAFDALDRLDGDRDLERCDLLIAEAAVLARAGRLERSIERSRAASVIARERRDGQRLAHAAIGSVGRLLPMGVLDPLDVALLEEALGQLEPTDLGLRAELGLRLAAHAHAAGDTERGDRMMAEATELARQSNESAVQALALRAQAYDRAGGFDPQERREAAGEALAIAEASGDPEAAAMATFLDLTASLVLGDVRRADRDAERLSHRVDQMRLLQIEPFLLGYLGTRAMMRGRLAEAEEIAIRTAAVGHRVNSPVAVMYFGTPQLAELRRSQGRAAEIADALATVPDQFPDQPGFIGPVALMLWEAGQHVQARALFDRAARIGFDQIARDANFLAVVSMFAESAHLMDTAEHASRLHALLQPHAQLYAAAGHAQAFMGPVHLPLGLLSGLIGEHQRADAELQLALEACERIESPPLVARTHLYWAQLHVRRSPRSADQIATHLSRAIDVGSSCELQAVVESARRMQAAR